MEPASQQPDEPPEPSAEPRRETELEKLVGHVAHLLPAQGPISIFVHHNTLHAFEDLSFEAAVVKAGELFGCEPYLAEARYREELARGRITAADLRAVLRDELGDGAQTRAGPTPRLELRLAMLRHPIEHRRGAELAWLLSETPVLHRFLPGVSAEAAREVVEGTRRSLEHGVPSPAEERAALGALWQASLRLAARHPAPAEGAARLVRHRDLLLEATGEDSDALVHPLLIRAVGAFLDQGLSVLPMPHRELGLFRAFLRLYRQPGALPRPWMRGLDAELARQDDLGLDGAASAIESLDALGVPEHDWERFLEATLLALRGWAGMVRQVEVRPDRVPALPVPARLLDFVALRLLLERFALAHLAESALGFRGPLSELCATLRPLLPAPPRVTDEERAFPLFQVAQALGLSAAILDGLAPEDAAAWVAELDSFTELERRRHFQLAYERRYREEVLDALCLHASSPAPPRERPRFQAVFCIDEREESMRRHLEEAEPACETFGSAGFFGVAMYYRGVADARPVPLCPVVVRPSTEVEEVVAEELRGKARRRARARRLVGRAAHGVAVGSRSFAGGAVLSALAGSLAAFPLVWRVLFPRLTARLRRSATGFLEPPKDTRLELEHRPEAKPTLGERVGFPVEERAAIVRRVLEETGLAAGMAPFVVMVGHGSSSLNNPHESAYDCGACGGNRGGPNARAFAMMANDERVRERLRAEGLLIPPGTRFVGAFHNSCDDSMTWYEVEDLAGEARERFQEVQRAFERARAKNAHERCRRFASAPLDLSAEEALAHVEGRTEDLAQPRPECGHATNAFCVVGRRERTRGLFLDRRAFLVSYDPAADDAQGTVLERVLSAITPVCAGISLEYFFSYVDPCGYGCSTKLPHNVTGMLGVMDGHASDLRPGLPWQMVEIHEPLRLLLVVEAEPRVASEVLARNASLARLVRNGWIHLATLAPSSAEVHLRDGRRERFLPYLPESREMPVVGASIDWYAGRREHLRCARVVAGRHSTTLEAVR